MYLGVDVGGTKTLLAVFSDSGELVYKNSFPTDKVYSRFLSDLKKELKDIRLKGYNLQAICCALPGRLDRQSQTLLAAGNLGWKNISIVEDLTTITPGLPIYIENDAKLAALAESNEFRDFKKLLCLMIGTGIGIGITINGVIDSQISDVGGKGLVLERKGKLVNWEDLASGRAIVKNYGKKASEIRDPKLWEDYAKLLALGMYEYIATFSPDIVVVGGGIGNHFNKFKRPLEKALNTYKNPMVDIPPIVKANKPEEAVAYGCYYYIRQRI